MGPATIAFDFLYPAGIRGFWTQTILRNPVAYGAALSGLVVTLLRARKDSWFLLLGTFSLALLALCVWHKQPWPYFFVFILPTCAITTAAGFSRFTKGGIVARALAALIVSGCCYSLWLRVPRVLEQDASYQEQTVRAAHAFVGPDDFYFAGAEILWQRQHLPVMPWLDAPRRSYYKTHEGEALKLLKQHPKARLVIDNNRVRDLPNDVLQWFSQNYSSEGGSLFLVSLPVSPGEQEIDFAQGGLFRLQASSQVQVHVAGASVVALQTLKVAPGRHRVVSNGPGRLIAWSNETEFLLSLRTERKQFFWPAYTY